MPRRQSRTGCERCGRAVRTPRYLARMVLSETVVELGATGTRCALTAAGTPQLTHAIRVWQSLSTATDDVIATARTTRGVFSASPALENWTNENFRAAQKEAATQLVPRRNSQDAQVAAAKSRHAERLMWKTDPLLGNVRFAKHAHRRFS
jgi:hypothetical protein